MEHPQTPRVLQPHLSSFQHRIVRVLGKVVQLRGENAVVDAGGQIDVILNRVSIFKPVVPPHMPGWWGVVGVVVLLLVMLAMHRGGEMCWGPNINVFSLERVVYLGLTGQRADGDQDAHLAVGHAVELIGKVDGNLAIKVQAATDFGTGVGKYIFLLRWLVFAPMGGSVEGRRLGGW
jgi:hypothetical protein